MFSITMRTQILKGTGATPMGLRLGIGNIGLYQSALVNTETESFTLIFHRSQACGPVSMMVFGLVPTITSKGLLFMHTFWMKTHGSPMRAGWDVQSLPRSPASGQVLTWSCTSMIQPKNEGDYVHIVFRRLVLWDSPPVPVDGQFHILQLAEKRSREINSSIYTWRHTSICDWKAVEIECNGKICYGMQQGDKRSDEEIKKIGDLNAKLRTQHAL